MNNFDDDLDEMEDQIGMTQYKRRSRDIRAEKVIKQNRPKDKSSGFNVSQGVIKRQSATIREFKRGM